jgi:restriction endonuclease
MSLTKRHLSEMKEKELQNDVLISLFQAMKYQDVKAHGGRTEYGKDIVMWRETDVSPRLDYAVVVKAEKITGKTTGNAGVSTILTQIRQCVGKNYLDHITTEARQVKHVYVVSSKEITQEAIEHIEADLSASGLKLIVEFIDGEKLWELIERHMSEKTVLYRLAQIKKICDEADPYYRIVPVMNQDSISFTIQPKDPRVLKDHPLRFSPYFTFHKTPEGRAKGEEISASLKAGYQVTIPNEYVEHLGLPDLLTRFIQPGTLTDWKITVGSLPPILLVKVEMESIDGASAVFHYLPLQRFDEADGRTLYKNQGQLVPWRFELGLDKRTKQFDISYQLKYEGINVNWALESARFQRAISKGGTLRVRSLETDLPIIVNRVQPGTLEELDERWIEILEKLLLIQRKTLALFSAPTGSLSADEVREIYELAFILENGYINLLTKSHPMKISEKEAAQELLNYAALEHFSVAFGRQETAMVLGKEITLGRAEYKFGKVTLSGQDWDAIKLFAETGAPEGGLDITIVPLENSEAKVEYLELPSWDSPKPSDFPR